MYEFIKQVGNYIVNVLVAIDRLANALLFGSPEMTLSGRMGRDIANGKCGLCKAVCWFLNLIQRNHCANAAQYDKNLGGDAISKE